MRSRSARPPAARSHRGSITSRAAGAAASLLALAGTGWGTLPPREAPAYAHATLFDGEGWVRLTLHEKELLVHGFLLGAAAEQAAPAGRTAAADPVEGRAVAREVAELRRESGLHYSLAPALLARRLDEFYWWRNHRDIPLAGALAEVNHRLRTEHF